MFGLRWDQILLLFNSRDELSEMVADFSLLPLPQVLKKHRELIQRLTDSFAKTERQKPNEEAAAKAKAAPHVETFEREMERMNRSTSNVDNN